MSETEIQQPVLPFKKRAARSLGRAAMVLFVPPLRSLPLGFGRRVGSSLAMAAFYLLKRYRGAAIKNLNLVYGAEKSESERLQMAKQVFRHFGMVGAEFLKMPSISNEKLDAMITVIGEENLKKALEPGSGVLLITGHFGNWELIARWLASHGYPINVVARDARDPMATKLLADTRGSNGAKVLYRGNSARAVLQCLKKNEIVGILPDQNAADVFVPFLGVRTGTVDGPAIIHLKTAAPLLFTWCIRTPDGRFEIEFEPPVVIKPSAGKQADVEEVMTVINQRIGDRIRQNPTQWLWLHNRWKASPGVFEDGEANMQELLSRPTRAGR
jgi:Kdo2-lipid IVA lauroyltransferase/acyltransferase